MKKLFLLIVFIVSICELFANRVDNIQIPPPRVVLTDINLKEITLIDLNIETKVISSIATSTYELIFYNPNNRILEGELVFSLLDGQSVIDYALDIDGKYRFASIVPKAKAKEAYEDTIRAKIDPSIIEKTVGNNFKTKLYPIPAKGYKKIKIVIQEYLTTKNQKQKFIIPFTTKDKLKNFSLNIDLISLNKKKSVDIVGVDFDRVSKGESIKFKKSNIKLTKPIIIDIENSQNINTFIQKKQNDTFLFSTINHNSKSITKALPTNIALLWNTSFSNKNRDIDKELEFLKEYLDKVASLYVEVYLFSNEIVMNKTLKICSSKAKCKGESFESLKDILKSANYDGTTNFSKIDISKINAPNIFLFSNGIKTIFSEDLSNINKKITTINSSIKSDTNLLKKYAKLSNSKFIDLTKSTPKEAIEELSLSKPIFEIINHSKDINTNNLFIEYKNNQILLVAKANQGWIELEIIDNGKITKRKIDFQNATAVDENLDSIWASQKIENLSFDYKQNREEIINLAKKYKILTKDTSLIVLDRVEDYVKYEITPPDDLKVEYDKLIKTKIDEKLYEKEKALIESIQILEEQKVWYNKDFPKTKKETIKEKDKFAGDVDVVEDNVDVSEPSPVMPSEEPKVEIAPTPTAKTVIRESSVGTNITGKNISLKKTAKEKPKDKDIVKDAKIELKEFNPKAPYIENIKSSSKESWIKNYYKEKGAYINQPMFYVDVATLLHKNGMKKEAILILSNILELDFENSEFLRVFAFKAMELKEYDLAIRALKEVKNLRPFEAQSFRDLALAYVQNKEYQKATDNLYYILTHTWDSRFYGTKIVVINELNNLLSLHKEINKESIDKRLIYHMPVDLRIVINWSSDNTDIDLWIIDPYGEKTFYSNKISHIGGKISNDITMGYGPEEFMLKEAIKGKYKIKANYFGNNQQKISIPVTIRVEMYNNYSKEAQKQKEIVIRVENQKEEIDIGKFEF